MVYAFLQHSAGGAHDLMPVGQMELTTALIVR